MTLTAIVQSTNFLNAVRASVIVDWKVVPFDAASTLRNQTIANFR